MSPTTDLGVDVEVVDDPGAVVAPTATDPCILLHSVTDGPAYQKVTSRDQARELYDGDNDLIANTDAFFGEGGATLHVTQIDEDIPAAFARLPEDIGPAQVVAPEVVLSPDLVAIAQKCWDEGWVALLNGPDGATTSALTALADAVKAAEGRNASLEADTMIIPGLASGQTREVSAAIVKAGIIARSDRATLNPILAAAGEQGICQYAIGIKAERNRAARGALKAEQINTFRNLYGQSVRSYGFRTLADLDEYPQWWDLSGSRTIMAVRALEGAVAERHMFNNIDAEGLFLTRYEGALRAELAGLQAIGAIYGTTQVPGYTVAVTQAENPVAQLSQGIVVTTIRAKTSPFAEVLKIRIARRALTEEI